MRSPVIATGLLVASSVLSGCRTTPPRSRAAPDAPVGHRPAASAQIVRSESRLQVETDLDLPRRIAEAQTWAPRIASLSVRGDTLRLRVGERTRVDSLPIAALDSAGVDLGRLPVLTPRFVPGHSLDVTPTVIEGLAPGAQWLVISVPRLLRQGRTDPAPSVEVPVLVRP